MGMGNGAAAQIHGHRYKFNLLLPVFFFNGIASLLFLQFCTCFPSTMMSFCLVFFLMFAWLCFALGFVFGVAHVLLQSSGSHC